MIIKRTQIIYTGELPEFFDVEVLQHIYGYKFDVKHVEKADAISEFKGSTIFISQQDAIYNVDLNPNIDFFINIHPHLGSVIVSKW